MDVFEERGFVQGIRILVGVGVSSIRGEWRIHVIGGGSCFMFLRVGVPEGFPAHIASGFS